MNEEYPGRRATTTVETTQLQNGNWGIYEKIIHARSKDLVNWEERDISIRVVDKDLDHGMAQAILSLTQYLETVDYDLFNTVEEEPKELLQ